MFRISTQRSLPSASESWDDIGCSRSSETDVGNLGAAGEFAAVTDGEINRSDNRARCTCRRKETNEQTHNRRRVIYTNHLDAIMTDRSGRSRNYLAKLVASLATWSSTRAITSSVIRKNCIIRMAQDVPLEIAIIYFKKTWKEEIKAFYSFSIYIFLTYWYFL